MSIPARAKWWTTASMCCWAAAPICAISIAALGVEDKVRWYKRITFIEPGGRSSFIEASSLPAPFHSAISFLRYKLLSLRDKLGIARALMALLAGVPEDSGEDFLSWLRRKGQTQAPLTASGLRCLSAA